MASPWVVCCARLSSDHTHPVAGKKKTRGMVVRRLLQPLGQMVSACLDSSMRPSSLGHAHSGVLLGSVAGLHPMAGTCSNTISTSFLALSLLRVSSSPRQGHGIRTLCQRAVTSGALSTLLCMMQAWRLLLTTNSRAAQRIWEDRLPKE